jgi:hypothetical protein
MFDGLNPLRQFERFGEFIRLAMDFIEKDILPIPASLALPYASAKKFNNPQIRIKIENPQPA